MHMNAAKDVKALNTNTLALLCDHRHRRGEVLY